jgi:hypothetical protein
MQTERRQSCEQILAHTRAQSNRKVRWGSGRPTEEAKPHGSKTGDQLWLFYLSRMDSTAAR